MWSKKVTKMSLVALGALLIGAAAFQYQSVRDTKLDGRVAGVNLSRPEIDAVISVEIDLTELIVVAPPYIVLGRSPRYLFNIVTNSDPAERATLEPRIRISITTQFGTYREQPASTVGLTDQPTVLAGPHRLGFFSESISDLSALK